jgi:isochorismate synthase
MEEKLETFNQILEKASPRASISRIIDHTLAEGHSFALWNAPQNEHHNLIINLGEPVKITEVDLESSDPGFLISAFDQTDRYFLRADLSYETKGQSLELLPGLNPGKTESAGRMVESISDRKGSYHVNPRVEGNEPVSYLDLVNESISAVTQRRLEKIVPARTKVIDTQALSPIDLYFELTRKYPNAFIYLISVKNLGTWIGATPELLLRVEDARWFQTVSLAGTQPFRDDLRLSQVAWTQKEIEEQALVSRYIINCFKKIRLREFEEHGPKTVLAGNLMHLKTTFNVDMQETNFPQLGSVMLELLHPTSAVCGMPREDALQFLNDHEHLDRKLFSGYLGPVRYANKTSLYVNLRCLEYHGSSSTLYAGAGITEDSDPEKEVNETEMKFNTILEAINSIS